MAFGPWADGRRRAGPAPVARGGHGGGGANPGHYTVWTLSPATGREQPSPRRTETGDTLSGTLAPAPAGPPGGPGIAAWAGPARPKDETSNELTLITNITDEAY